jgi:hypothetical protein
MATVHDQPTVEEAAHTYEQYAKALEEEHRGEFVAVSRDGQTLIAPTLVAALKQATAKFGPGNFIFKIGERAVGKWRWLSAAS